MYPDEPADPTGIIPQLEVDTDPNSPRIRLRAPDPYAHWNREYQIRRRRAWLKIAVLAAVAVGLWAYLIWAVTR